MSSWTGMDHADRDPGHPAIVTLDWRDHGRYLVNGLLDMLRRSSHVDTDIGFDVTDDGPSTASHQSWPLGLKVHRLVLSVFLSSTLIEDTKLDLNDVAEEADDVRVLIEFIYTGRVTVRKDRIEPLHRLAHALQFDGFAKTIAELQRRIDKEQILHNELPAQGNVESVVTDALETMLTELSEEPKQCSIISRTELQPGPIRIKVETDEEISTLCSKSSDDSCSFHNDYNSGKEGVDPNDNCPCPFDAPSFMAMAVVHPDSRLFECDQSIFDTPHQMELERHVIAHDIKAEPIDSKDTIREAIDILDLGQPQTDDDKDEWASASIATPKAYFRCRHCPRTFINLFALTHHMKLKHRMSSSIIQMIVLNNSLCHRTRMKKTRWKVLLRCGQCNKICSLACNRRPKTKKAKKSGKQQQQQHVKCLLCPNGSYADIRSLKEHVQLNHQSVTVVCHDVQKDVQNSLTCQLCHKWFADRAILECHVKATHAGNENVQSEFKGQISARTFKNDSERRRFFYKSINKRFFECPQCDSVFSRSGNFNRHMRVVHKATDFAAPFKCPHCTQYFPFRIRMLRHVQMEHGGDCGNELISCYGKRPVSREELNVQMDVDVDVKPSDKVLARWRAKPPGKSKGKSTGSGIYCQLRGNGPAIGSSSNHCMLCQCVFDKDDELREHMSKFHPDVEVFACNACPFWTIQQLRLKRHRCKRRNAERTRKRSRKKGHHQCRLCGRAFGFKHNFLRHMANLHGYWKQYRCRLCFCTFQRLHELKRHEATKHFRPEGSPFKGPNKVPSVGQDRAGGSASLTLQQL